MMLLDAARARERLFVTERRAVRRVRRVHRRGVPRFDRGRQFPRAPVPCSVLPVRPSSTSAAQSGENARGKREMAHPAPPRASESRTHRSACPPASASDTAWPLPPTLLSASDTLCSSTAPADCTRTRSPSSTPSPSYPHTQLRRGDAALLHTGAQIPAADTHTRSSRPPSCPRGQNAALRSTPAPASASHRKPSCFWGE
ncbi:hypothetical protein C8R46DRAFT_1278442 [Mycena filopes]|nr:hypothetical protein C8R46DRAFT_1278442 [Mycena filopes]